MELMAFPVMALDRTTVDSSTSPTRSLSLISKFTNRFGNRNRSISDFHIEPDDPWKTYSPGDLVKGSVILTVTKPVRITHLVVCLHGYAKVFKNAVAPGEQAEDSGYLGPGRGRRGGEYRGNGFASLFEDEVVLCGEGRLKEGIYKFGFELCFPPYRLPSSIHFERGTISYVITATLTRPTSISPTMTCDKRIVLLEPIDIAPIPIPKSKVMSLEPISRRARARSRNSKSGDRLSNGTRNVETSHTSSDLRPPLSPVASEGSSSSCITDSTQSFQIVSDQGLSRCTASPNGDIHGIAIPQSNQTITATTKLLRAGALPGDVLPIHISIQHTKPIRSPNGIIITFYRQGRVDSHPAIPIGVPEKGKKPVYEDYYPKSRTGLGGLAFGATRPCSLFRKDLSQSFSPLIIDPNSMKAEVKTSVRVPEDCFPTITRVPGDMISFRYFVEVVMDLGGKLASHNNFLPRLSAVNSASKYCPNGRLVSAIDKGRGMVATDYAGNVVDTDQVRREKNVVACVFEVVVGTKDSRRGSRQQNGNSSQSNQSMLQQQQRQDTDPPQRQKEQHAQPTGSDDGYFGRVPQQSTYHSQEDEVNMPTQDGYYHRYYYPDEAYDWQYQQRPPSPPENPPPPHFVAPVQPDEVVDEKTRLRRAEEMLLPSEPPPSESAAGSSSAPLPSAPILLEDDTFPPHYPAPYHHPDPGRSGSYANTPVPLAPSVAIRAANASFPDAVPPQQPSPSYTENSGQPATSQDDKQELERQRLLQQASAPPDDQHSESEGSSVLNNARNESRPSAPAFTEEDLIGHVPPAGESLPRYQR
ncbi:hypothetical protein VTO42DRAFT_5761 [Malbranchea cinnamomea]